MIMNANDDIVFLFFIYLFCTEITRIQFKEGKETHLGLYRAPLHLHE